MVALLQRPVPIMILMGLISTLLNTNSCAAALNGGGSVEDVTDLENQQSFLDVFGSKNVDNYFRIPTANNDKNDNNEDSDQSVYNPKTKSKDNKDVNSNSDDDDDGLYTPIHSPNTCAIYSSCGKQSLFGPELPCPANVAATDPDAETRKTLMEVCGDNWSEGPICCDIGQVCAQFLITLLTID